jgi:hypothetical protein
MTLAPAQPSEHQDDVAPQLLPAGVEQPGRPGQHRRVEVVAAAVHGAVDLRPVLDVGELLDGQGVHVGAQQDDRARRAAGRRTTAQDAGDRGRLPTERRLEGEAVEGGEDALLGLRQVQPELGVPVQRPPELTQIAV